MKKWMFVTIIVSLVLALTACGSTQSSNAAATASTTLSLEGQLLVGTFKLENTTLAISSKQASTLLPLWETLESLASSNTAASQEVDAVVSQIESTMSSQQVSSITAMKLTQKDLAAAALDTGTTSTTCQLGQYGQGQRGPTPDGRWCSGWRKSTQRHGRRDARCNGCPIRQPGPDRHIPGGRHTIHRDHRPGIRGNDQRVGGSASEENWINLCDRFFR
jgi:hypothetical protein